jgi:hypothetical protein
MQGRTFGFGRAEGAHLKSLFLPNRINGYLDHQGLAISIIDLILPRLS